MSRRAIAKIFIASAVYTVAATGLAFGQDASGAYTLTIKDHRFEPAELNVPAGKPIKVRVKNLDSTPEEFESKALKREKVIPGGKEGVVNIGPLKPGTYEFVGEFHESTAKGRIVAK